MLLTVHTLDSSIKPTMRLELLNLSEKPKLKNQYRPTITS